MVEKNIQKHITAVYNAVMADPYNIHHATKYIDEKTVVRLTRRHKHSKRNLRSEFVLTIGRPNYLEVRFVKQCKAANEPSPVKKVQIKLNPVRRKKAKK